MTVPTGACNVGLSERAWPSFFRLGAVADNAAVFRAQLFWGGPACSLKTVRKEKCVSSYLLKYMKGQG